MAFLRYAAAAACVLAAGAAPALSATTLPASDSMFLNKATMGGLAEVQAGQLAEQKGSRPDVKQFANQMVKDHGEANSEMAQLASAKGVTIPAVPDAQHAAAMQRLSQLSGTQFDRQYMKGQVTDHKTTVALFKQEANSGRDPQLRAYAQKYLPILQHHLQMAESTSVGG